MKVCVYLNRHCCVFAIDLHTVCTIGGPVVACFVPACHDATCDSNPGLTCHADACEPCTPVFHDDNNNLQSCTLGKLCSIIEDDFGSCFF